MSAVCNLTYRQLAHHLLALRVEHIQRLVRPLLQRLMQHPKNTDIFNKPVDPVALCIPHYFSKIRHPMDLGTIKSRLQRGEYRSLDDIFADISLVFDNALLFNPPQHTVHEVAKLIKQEFKDDLASLKDRLQREVSNPFKQSVMLLSSFVLTLFCFIH